MTSPFCTHRTATLREIPDRRGHVATIRKLSNGRLARAAAARIQRDLDTAGAAGFSLGDVLKDQSLADLVKAASPEDIAAGVKQYEEWKAAVAADPYLAYDRDTLIEDGGCRDDADGCGPRRCGLGQCALRRESVDCPGEKR